jgi:hypothetical protein
MLLPTIMLTDILPKLEFAEHPWIQPATMLLEPYSSAELLGMVDDALSTNPVEDGEIAQEPTLKNRPVHNGQ